MAQFSHLLVPFYGPASSGPATWGQQQIWREIRRMASNPAFGNQTQGMAIPAGLMADQVADEIGALVSRYESLRTVFYEDDAGLLVQEVVAGGQLQVQVIQAAGQEPDLLEISLRAEESLLTTPFDHGADLPFRAVIGVVDGMARQLLLGQSHLAVDFLSGRLLVRELTALLAARAAGDPRPDAPPALQPVQQAAVEHSDRGGQLLSRSLRHWSAELRSGPSSMFPGPPAAPAVPRYWRGAIRSRAVPPAAELLAARYKVSTSVILLAAMSALLSRSVGQQRCLTRIVAGNRIAAGLRDAVGTLSQEVPATIDVSGASFESVVRSTWSSMMRALRQAQYPPAEAETLLAALSQELGTDIELSVCFNDLWSPAREPGPGLAAEKTRLELAAQHTTFGWEDRIEQAGVAFFLEVTGVPGAPGLARLSLLADTSLVPAADVEPFLRAMEGLLIRLTAGEVDLTRLAPVIRAAGRAAAAGGRP
jgi:hypothetical protein